MPATDAPKPINIRNLDPQDRQTLRHAAVDAGTNLTEYIRRICHAEAERLRAKLPSGPATGYKFEFTVTGIDERDAEGLLQIFANHTENAHGELGGGYHQVDDNGYPVN